MHFIQLQFLFVLTCVLAMNPVRLHAWQSDNGNGTFTNPLFYDEFSDPDIIRVSDDYYFTGTTMHTMPGLPVLRSKDLVNWEFLGYALDKLNLGPEFRLEKGKTVYGQGIWAPSFPCHNGTFYIFSNVNGRKTQLFTATNPAGPWQHTELKHSFHDLSVLFDDDGKVYVVWGYEDIYIAQLTADLKDIVPGLSDCSGESPVAFHWRGHYWLFRDIGKGLALYRSDDALHWSRAGTLLADHGTGPDDTNVGHHPDVILSDDCAYLFYFGHPDTSTIEAVSPDGRRSSIQVVEMKYDATNNILTADRNQPAMIHLQPPKEVETESKFN
jgi:beta-xylosidase